MESSAIAIETALKGEPTSQLDDVSTASFFRRAVAAPMMRHFDLNVRPKIAAAYAGSGNFLSSSRANAEALALGGVQSELSSRLAQAQFEDRRTNVGLRESAADRALQAVTLANTQATEPQRRFMAQAKASSVFQDFEQRKLDTDFQEYMRVQPENSPFLGQAMQFFGGQPPTPNSSRKNLGGVGAGAGAVIGGTIGSAFPGLGTAVGAGIGAAVGGGAGSMITY